MKLKDETVLSMGMMSLAIGILIGRFTYFAYSSFSISDFLQGVLYGLPFIMNLFYFFSLKQKKKVNKNNG